MLSATLDLHVRPGGQCGPEAANVASRGPGILLEVGPANPRGTPAPTRNAGGTAGAPDWEPQGGQKYGFGMRQRTERVCRTPLHPPRRGAVAYHELPGAKLVAVCFEEQERGDQIHALHVAHSRGRRVVLRDEDVGSRLNTFEQRTRTGRVTLETGCMATARHT